MHGGLCLASKSNVRCTGLLPSETPLFFLLFPKRPCLLALIFIFVGAQQNRGDPDTPIPSSPQLSTDGSDGFSSSWPPLRCFPVKSCALSRTNSQCLRFSKE